MNIQPSRLAITPIPTAMGRLAKKANCDVAERAIRHQRFALTLRLLPCRTRSMYKLRITFIVLLSVCAAVYAGPESIQSSGKEMKDMVAPAQECDFNWTGFYVGLRAGDGWNVGDVHNDPLPDPASFNQLAYVQHPDGAGVLGGGEIGFNWQIHKFVLGVEADFSGSDIDGNSVISPISDSSGVPFGSSRIHVNDNVDWFGTFRGRIGFVPTCRLLVYATGGLAYANVDFSGDTDYTPTFDERYPVSRSDTQFGWTAGAGIEYALTHHWSIKAEYLYFDVGSESQTVNQIPAEPPYQIRYRWETEFHTITAGVNFKF